MVSKSEKKNKGEWSEFYAFLKILEDQVITAADRHLESIPDKYFVFKKIFRGQEFAYTWDGSKINIEALDGTLVHSVDRSDIGVSREKIFKEISSASGGGAFFVESAQDIMLDLKCDTVSADSGSKSDIDAVIEDRVSNSESWLGFSVKSMVGGAATLLNASKDQTNFLYHVSNLSVEQMCDVNAIEGRSKIRDRIDMIKALGGVIEFRQMCSDNFARNARKIDTFLPEFLSEMLLGFYATNASSLTDLVGYLTDETHFGVRFGLGYPDFAFKVQQFLVAATLGMVPSKPWDGRTKAQGGYIVVKQDGDVVCYHLYNRDLFLGYLFENTKFETPSSSRHGFGTVFQDENDDMFLKLNLQIRFKK